MIAPTAVIDLPAANAQAATVLRTLARHPDDAWFRLAGENLGEGLSGAHGWIRPTASGGSYEFRIAGVSDAAPAAAQLQAMLGMFAKQASDGLRPMLQPYIDHDPKLTSQRRALVDGFLASVDTALTSAQVEVDQGDVVIRGTTDAAALEANFPVLLSGIQ
jgi:hypothetical protein